LRPLHERPADIPQIALALWSAIWAGRPDPLHLGPLLIEQLLLSETTWEGNVRQLRAFLSLAASRRRLTGKPLLTIFKEIFALGDYGRWVGIILKPSAPPRITFSPARLIPCCLSAAGMDVFNEICKGLPATRAGMAKTDSRTRLVNIIEAVARNGSIKKGGAKKLNHGSENTAKSDLEILAGARGKLAILKRGEGDSPEYAPADITLFK
jgi:transcriptional regulator with GAF, ATPase, and Fis domain